MELTSTLLNSNEDITEKIILSRFALAIGSIISLAVSHLCGAEFNFAILFVLAWFIAIIFAH